MLCKNNFICRSHCLSFACLCQSCRETHQVRGTVAELWLVNKQIEHSHESEPSYIRHSCLWLRVMNFNLVCNIFVVHADTIFIVQRRDGDVMISLFAGDDRPEEATEAVSKQVH